MSKLGNIKESFGKQINIAVANTYSSNVLASTLLPKNTLIISAPTETDKQGNIYDIGTHNIIMTDNYGGAVRLTYTIKQGNGLNIDSSNTDIIKLSIDNDTLTTNEFGELTVNKRNIIDNNTLVINENDKIEVNVNNLTSATETTFGVVKIDDETIKTTNIGQIYVETENLDRANDNQYGVVTSDNKTVHIDSNGILSVVTHNLNKATATTLGVVKIDGNTIKTNNDVIYVSTENLDRATKSTIGVAKVDGTTLLAVSGVISVNTNALGHATNDKYGLVKFDDSIVIKNGIASVKDYENIISAIESEKSSLIELQNLTEQLQNLISDKSLLTKGGIYSFTCNDTTITNLVKPAYKEEPINMKTQHVYVSMNIITDCDFNISVLYENNETPAIELSQINYNDEFSYQGFDGLLKVYPSTEMKQKRVILLFNCKNFRGSATKPEKTTKITITISSVDNKEIKKSLLYSVVRYNSNARVRTKTDETIVTEKPTYTPILSESFWKEDKEKLNPRRGFRHISEKEI